MEFSKEEQELLLVGIKGLKVQHTVEEIAAGIKLTPLVDGLINKLTPVPPEAEIAEAEVVE